MIKIFQDANDDSAQNEIIGDFRSYVQRHLIGCPRILEIGPSHSPVLPRRLGFNTEILDHADAEALRQKYTLLGQDVSQIEDVDFVWSGQKISKLCNKRYGAIFLSHVIEHMTDFLSFINECEDLLGNAGELILIIPDKLYCFDLLQPLTDTAKIIGDHLAKRTRHTFEAFYREDSHAVAIEKEEARITWGQKPTRWKMKGSWDDFLDQSLRKLDSPNYEDAHEYYFTPSSFREGLNK